MDNYHTHEIHLWVDGVYVLLKADSYEGVIAPVEDRLKTLASQIFKVIDPVHAGPGFIFGPIIIRGDHDHESAVIEFYDPERLDMTFEAHVSAMTPDDDTPLFQRADQGLPILQRLGIGVSTLRKDTREIGDMEAQEQLLATVSDRLSGHPIRALSFAAETYRDVPALARPTLFLKMEAGGDRKWKSPEEIQTRTMLGAWTLPSFVTLPESSSSGEPRPPVTSSLTDYEAMAVWDAILKSIRPRPGAVSPPKPKSEAIPVGPNPDKLDADRRTLDKLIEGANTQS